MSVTTLDLALDVAMQLPGEQREMLLEILKRRAVEPRRKEIAADARVPGGLPCRRVKAAIRR